MRKRITNVQLQTELVDILKNMFLPSKKMIKEQIEWLIEHKYMKRDEDDINTFIYMAWNHFLPCAPEVLTGNQECERWLTDQNEQKKMQYKGMFSH